MGLDAAVYADDNCETEIASVRIGNLDGVVRLREAIKERFPDAAVLLTKVLYSASHCGDSLRKEDVAKVRMEFEKVAERCPYDEFMREFVAGFGGVVTVAMKHDRPVTFT